MLKSYVFVLSVPTNVKVVNPTLVFVIPSCPTPAGGQTLRGDGGSGAEWSESGTFEFVLELKGWQGIPNLEPGEASNQH